MEATVVEVRFPRAPIPVRAYRCPVCGHEEVLAPDLARAQRWARELGLFGVEDSRTRTLQRHGNSTVVTLDPAFLRDALDGAGVGDKVRVGREGNRIVIEPAEG